MFPSSPRRHALKAQASQNRELAGGLTGPAAEAVGGMAARRLPAWPVGGMFGVLLVVFFVVPQLSVVASVVTVRLHPKLQRFRRSREVGLSWPRSYIILLAATLFCFHIPLPPSPPRARTCTHKAATSTPRVRADHAACF